MQKNRENRRAGYTLIETLVAFTMFSVVLGSMVSLTVIAAQSQRRSLGIQDIVGEISFVGEMTTRALRQAQKELNSPAGCLNGAGFGRGWNYQILNPDVNGVGDGVRFLDRDNKCREFYFDTPSAKLKERKSTDEQSANFALPADLTSDGLRVLAFRVKETGAFQGDSVQQDNLQPRITFILEAESTRAPGVSRVHVQSTITQRTLDIRK